MASTFQSDAEGDMTVRIPSYLHEVFGESQTVGELLAIVLFGLGGAAGLFLASPAITHGQSSWRSAVAFLLVADILAGCVANFTRSTNDYYATRGKHRLVFIAVHVHVLLVAWLLGLGFWAALIVWGYTIAGALVVNALKASQFQVLVAGALLVLGIALVVLGMETPTYFLLISLLFMVKVLFAFPVDHYPKAPG